MKYISSIFKTGAVRKTPDRIIQKIISEIDPAKQGGFIEFGAGKGEITTEILKLKSTNIQQASYYAFEIDQHFAQGLRAAVPGVNVLSEDAFAFDDFIPFGFIPDYIICSIPLSFYPKEKMETLIQKMESKVASGGKVIILFHAFWLIPFLRRRLKGSLFYRYTTLPPYFLLVKQKV